MSYLEAFKGLKFIIKALKNTRKWRKWLWFHFGRYQKFVDMCLQVLPTAPKLQYFLLCAAPGQLQVQLTDLQTQQR